MIRILEKLKGFKEAFFKPVNGPWVMTRQIPFRDEDFPDGSRLETHLGIEMCQMLMAHPVKGGKYISEHIDTVLGDRGSKVTVTRRSRPLFKSVTADDAAHVSGYDWVNVPLGRCPVDAKIGRITIYQTAKDGGTAMKLILGKVGDTEAFIAASDNISLNGTGVVVDEYYEDLVNTAVDVNLGDYLLLGSSGGVTSDPSGLHVELELIPKIVDEDGNCDQSVQLMAFGVI